jgi:PAS domain S-box-containing protein
MSTDSDEITPPLRELEERFFDLSIDMLCFLDFSGYFKRLNPAWETTLGFTRTELMSKPFIEFVHPDDRDRTLRQNRDVRGGGQARLFENRYLCEDGSYRWLLWNATPDRGRQFPRRAKRGFLWSPPPERSEHALRRAKRAAHCSPRLTAANALSVYSESNVTFRA